MFGPWKTYRFGWKFKRSPRCITSGYTSTNSGASERVSGRVSDKIAPSRYVIHCTCVQYGWHKKEQKFRNATVFSESHRRQRFFLFLLEFLWAHFFSRAFVQMIAFGIFIQQFNLSHLNHYICLLVLNGQTLCYFTANGHLNYPRPAPMHLAFRKLLLSWYTATAIWSGDRGFRDFFSFFLWADFLSRAITLKVSLGIFTQHCNLAHTLRAEALSFSSFLCGHMKGLCPQGI